MLKRHHFPLIMTQQAISNRLKVMGMVQKQGYWVSHELKPRDVESRFFTCEQLLQSKSEGFFASNSDGGRKLDPLRQSKAHKIVG